MRLYRGLKETYKPEQRPDDLLGVNFTDSLYIATLYASGRRGQILVLDLPDEMAEKQVRKELWLDDRAERLIVWGKFDDHLVGIIPAQELRKIVRSQGMAAMSDRDRAMILQAVIDKVLSKAEKLPIRTIDPKSSTCSPPCGGTYLSSTQKPIIPT